jgi:hypothetical protein
VSRRVSLPGADDLFKATQPAAPSAAGSPVDEQSRRQPSARVRHDEKITVYVTADELLDLEHTRLLLRREHGIAVDRGRIVRAAISLALEAVEVDGHNSPLVHRLRSR